MKFKIALLSQHQYKMYSVEVFMVIWLSHYFEWAYLPIPFAVEISLNTAPSCCYR